MRVLASIFTFVSLANAAIGSSSSSDTLIIGKEVIFLEEQPVQSGDERYWLNYSSDYREMPRTIRWGIQVEGGGMLLKNAWDKSTKGTPLSQLNPNRRHWRYQPTAGVSAYAMWNETLGLGAGYRQKRWSRSVEYALPFSANEESPYGYLYDETGFYQIDVVDVDSTGFYELDTTKVVTQFGEFRTTIHQIPVYLVFAYDQPRSLWSYQGMLGAFWSQFIIQGGRSAYLNESLTQLSTHSWSSSKQSSWSMFGKATVSRKIRGNCKSFMAISGAWPFQYWDDDLLSAKFNPVDLTFGISWEY